MSDEVKIIVGDACGQALQKLADLQTSLCCLCLMRRKMRGWSGRKRRTDERVSSEFIGGCGEACEDGGLELE